jgi:NDP-sugar pyrophosphorylase family protein
MLYTAHRINTIEELQQIPNNYGVEVDLRDDENGIYMAHDPYARCPASGVDFCVFLQYYKHRFIILNVKTEGIEFRCIELMKKYGIADYFFLDSSIPMIVKLLQQGQHNVAIRYSEYESLDLLWNLEKKFNCRLWVWVDCFSYLPIDHIVYSKLIERGHRICIVSPELQGRATDIPVYRDILESKNIFPDMICTKLYNIDLWKPPMHLIIPMSGVGQRFINAGYTVPKPLIEVDNKPMIEHVVNLFPGVSSVTFICNTQNLTQTSMESILRKIRPDCQILSIDKGNGPVDALVASGILNNNKFKEVIVSYCDYSSVYDFDKFLLDMRRSAADGGITYYTGFHPHMLGNDHYDYALPIGDNYLRKISQKVPFQSNKMEEYASNGAYYFRDGKILKKYAEELLTMSPVTNNGEYYVSEIYNLMVRDGLKIKLSEIEKMLQWGTPYDLECYMGWSEYFNTPLASSSLSSSSLSSLNFTMIIPLAGRGSRFSSYSLPKPMLPVTSDAGQVVPMVVAATGDLPKAKKYIYVCLDEHDKKYSISSILRQYNENSVTMMIPSVTEGQACTCDIALKGMDPEESILITACDNTCVYDPLEFQRLASDDKVDVIVFGFNNHPSAYTKPHMYAWLETDSNNKIKSVSCKQFCPAKHDIRKSYVIEGTMLFKRASYFLDGYRYNRMNDIRTNGEFYVDDVLTPCIDRGLNVVVLPLLNYICWGTPDDYETYLYWLKYFKHCAATKL